MGKEWLGERSGDKSTGEGNTGAKTGQSNLCWNRKEKEEEILEEKSREKVFV